MENTSNLKALYIILNAGFSEDIMEIARECGARGGTIVNARGSGANFTSILGTHVEPEKEMIISIVDETTADNIMKRIKEEKGVKSEANGICFCIPVDSVTQINKIES